MKKIYTFLLAALCLFAVGCKQKQAETAERQTAMQYRPLGATGLEVSEISIGCGGFGKLDSAASRELMTMALDSGMNYIDIYDADPTVRSNIGYALQGRRDEMIIQGHLGTIFKNGQHTKTRDVEETRQGFEDLLARLGTDHIEVGMVHITDSFEEWEEIQNSPFLEYVFQLKKEGKIKHIGLSSHNAEVALQAVKSGWVEVLMFSLNPAFDRLRGGATPWDKGAMDNLQAGIDPVRVELYDYCTTHKIAITVMKTFGGGGRLLDAKTSQTGRAYTPEQCIAYCLAKPCISTCILGIDNLDELKTDLHWLHATEAEKDWTAAEQRTEDKALANVSCTYCNHCSPCTQGIPIAKVNELLDKAETDGLTAELQAQYDALPKHGGDCTHCGACLTRCPFGVDIPSKMDAAKQKFGK
ncbi:MAG: aldo/keto reductase [Bacteroidales bacterium]|nr:aldo/keto reductase [Bacteroidales bacterium]